MSMQINLHATAIVIGTRGILFVGPSGAGKSLLALACIEAAHHAGQFSALIADDQIFIENAGGYPVANRPPSTANLIEIRHSGIGRLASIDAAILHVAVMVVDRSEAERLPPEEETFRLAIGLDLPLLRMPAETLAPLSVLAAMLPETVTSRGQ